MAQNEEQDKSEKASPYKLEQARKKGQVAKSMEINSVVTLTTFTILAMALFHWISSSVSRETKNYFVGAGHLEITIETTLKLFLQSIANVVTAFSPLIVALVFISIGVTMLQTKPVFTTHPLKPDFTKLNPVQGLKKLFSIKMLFELVKTIIKLSAIGTLIYLGFLLTMDDLIQATNLAGAALDEYWFLMFKTVAIWMILILVPFAIIDLIFTKQEFAKKMRMSKREVKEEIKRRDGDPEVRAKRKKIQAELLKKTSAVSNVKDSDVILTNPTHYAVALRYVPHEMIAPMVVAKGSDLLADQIKRTALKHNIPIFRQPKLARKIFKETEIDQPIMESNYNDIAPIFRWVFESKGKTF